MPKEIPQSGLPFFWNGLPVLDAVLRVVDAGTNTPKPVYSDAGLNTLRPNPVPMLGAGFFPAMYVGDGTYDVRIEDGAGFIFLEIDGLTGGEATSGGGSGGDADATKLASTGDIKWRYATGTLSGWVRGNGRTIGSASSGATERANADCHDLFVHLWNVDPNLAVLGGRGANAESDWAANKTIALPNARGRSLIALDDMGNTAAGQLAGGLFAFGNATTLGSYGGEASHALLTSELAPHQHSMTITLDAQGEHGHTGATTPNGDHNHTYGTAINKGATSGGGGLGNYWQGGDAAATTGNAGQHQHTLIIDPVGNHSHNVTATMENTGLGYGHNNLNPFLLLTLYVRL